MEIGVKLESEVGPYPTKIPGSIQAALHEAGVIPDWNVGMNHRLCEWVENRQWILNCELDQLELDSSNDRYVLEMESVDCAGFVLFDGEIVGRFDSSFRPWEFDLTDRIAENARGILSLILQQPPRWMGQFGRTSEMIEQKARFNFGWDWMPRMVQIGVSGPISLRQWGAGNLKNSQVSTAYDFQTSEGALTVRVDSEGDAVSGIGISLWDGDQSIFVEQLLHSGKSAVTLPIGKVEPWWPSGAGGQKLYTAKVVLLSREDCILDQREFAVGFRSVNWSKCAGSAAGSDPWICSINGRAMFLQGVNWTPILPNYADAADETYERLVTDYARMGCNTLRVWGGAPREREIFYALCDRLGILVWQEFPLSSAGFENQPPRDRDAMEEFVKAASWTIKSLQHHPCILLWCGGNELTEDRGDWNIRIPATLEEPLLHAFHELVESEDRARRFVSTSPSGPSFGAEECDFGKGVHWDTHGPWKPDAEGLDGWRRYWESDDSLFRSEVGCPGASSSELIEKYAGDEETFPASNGLALWRRTPWWTEWETAVEELGRNPASLDEYVEWSQNRQAEALSIAASACKARFPRCGGFLVWMGHDAFPCTANTSIIDFDGNWKPAAFALQKIFLSNEPQIHSHNSTASYPIGLESNESLACVVASS